MKNANSGYSLSPQPSSSSAYSGTDFSAMLPAISKVAVIGAGAAGLPAAQRLRDYGIEVKIFERNSVPGGGWLVVPFYPF